MSAGERASQRRRCKSRRSVGRKIKRKKIKTRFFFFLHNALPPTTITTTTVSRTLSRVEHFRVKVLSPRRCSEYTNLERRSTNEFQKNDIYAFPFIDFLAVFFFFKGLQKLRIYLYLRIYLLKHH